MALKPASASSQKWLTNFQQATQAMTDGVNAVTQAPGALAAAQVNYWLQRVQASAQKWATNVGAVGLGDWKQAMISMGIPTAQQHAAAKQGNYTKFITAYTQFLQGAVATVRAMPKGNLQASIARAAQMITLSAKWAQSGAYQK